MSIFDLQFLEISQVGSSYLNDSGLFQNREVRDGDTLVATHGLKVNKVSRMEKYSDITELYRKGGFVFFERLP